MQNNSIFKKRILDFLDFKGINKASFYRETGISRSTLDKKTGLSEDNVSKFFANYPRINPTWFLTGKGEMLINDIAINNQENNNYVEESQTIYRLKTDHNVSNQEIPLYNIEASAGLVELFQNTSNNTPIDTLKIPNLPKCDGAVFITGDSMYPLLKSGDIIIYKEINDFKTDIFWGEMYLISVLVAGEEFISVKYIQKSEEGNQYIKLVSQNRHHQPKDIQLNKVRAMALVKASVRINSMG